MRELTNEEMIAISGGINITGVLMAGIYRTINSVLDLGRSLGTSLRMLKANRFCSI